MPVKDSSSRPQTQQQRRTGYSFATHGAAASASSSGASVGKHVLRRTPGVDFWSPSWGEETIIRVFPAFDPNDKSKFDPYRLSNSYCDFGDWIRVYEAVRNFGNPGVTMLLHQGLDASYDAQIMNPAWVLYRAITQALNQGQGLPEWFPITKGGAGKSAQLSKPSKLYLVQCAIFRHKSKDTFSAGKPPLGASAEGPTIVMGLPPTAGETLIQLLEQKEEDWKGDPDDSAQYKYGDIVKMNEGSFVHVFELGKDPRSKFNASKQTNQASIYSSAPRTSSSSGGSDPKGYGVFITKTLDGGEHDLTASFTGFEDLITSKIRPWNEILEFKSDEDQARLIAPLFPASAILYAWRDHSSWIPDSVREAGSAEARRPSSAPVIGATNNPWLRPPTPASKPAHTEVEEDPFGGDDTSPDVESLDPVQETPSVVRAKAKLEEATRKKTMSK